MCSSYLTKTTFVNTYWRAKFFNTKYFQYIEAVTQTCSVKKAFLVISQNSQKTPCQGLYFNKVAGLGLWLLLSIMEKRVPVKYL